MIKSSIFINCFYFVCKTSTNFFFIFRFLRHQLFFLLIKTIEFLIIFFVIIVTNNIFESSRFILFSFSFNIIAYFALIINVNFVLIKKLKIKLIIKFIKFFFNLLKVFLKNFNWVKLFLLFKRVRFKVFFCIIILIKNFSRVLNISLILNILNFNFAFNLIKKNLLNTF